MAAQLDAQLNDPYYTLSNPRAAGVAPPETVTGGATTTPAAQGSSGNIGGSIFNVLNAMGNIQQKYNNQNAAADAAAAANTGIQSGLDATNRIYGQTTAMTSPYIGAGYQQINNLQQLQSQPLDVSSFLDPSMDFTMRKGVDALERSAAARGGALSGAALKDIADYSSGLASTNYQNAVLNAMNNRQAQAGIGEALYSGGLQGLGQQTQAGMGTQQGLAQLFQAQGLNRAGGIVGGNAAGAGNSVQNAADLLKAGTSIWDTVSSWWS